MKRINGKVPRVFCCIQTNLRADDFSIVHAEKGVSFKERIIFKALRNCHIIIRILTILQMEIEFFQSIQII